MTQDSGREESGPGFERCFQRLAQSGPSAPASPPGSPWQLPADKLAESASFLLLFAWRTDIPPTQAVPRSLAVC